MNTKNRLLKTIGVLAVMAVTLASPLDSASAAIIFQNDTFFIMESPNLQLDALGTGAQNTSIKFGNDSTASENGNITWDITNDKFLIDHTVDITGGLSATGSVNFSGASQTRIRESANPTTSAACTTLNELIVNTTSNRIEICTATGIAGAATWGTLPAGDASTLGGLTASQFLRSDTSTSYTSGTLTTDAGTTLDVNGVADLSGATRLALPSGAANPGTCIVGDAFYNTTSNTLQLCTATNTFSTAGPQDFESVFAKDADKTLTTGNQAFSIAAGTGNLTFNSGAFSSTSSDNSNLTLTGNSASNLAMSIAATNAGAGQGNVAITAEDQVSISSSTWNITGAGVASGLTGITSTGTVNFSGTSSQRMREVASITAAACTTVNEIALDTTTKAIYICTATGTPGTWKRSSGAASNLRKDPEYPDQIIFKDGTNNNGTLSADYDSASNVNEHYYDWSSTKGVLQDIEVRFRMTLPADYKTTGAFTFRYKTGLNAATNNAVDFSILNATDLTTGAPTSCGTSTGNFSNNAWATGTIAAATITTGCTGSTALDAGDVVEIRAKLFDNSTASSLAQVGYVNLAYTN
ncbi:MAG: hypothetical protein ACK4NC_05255 [Candidatus Gracilibacteria bacterium]